MLSAKNGVTVRKALLSDYDAVVGLAKIYGGRDYLISLYKYWMTSPGHYGVVAVVDGAVAGFYLASSFDGGLTIMKRAGRVAETFRGRGLFQQMEAELDKYSRENHPDARYDSFAIISESGHLTDKFIRKGYREVYRKTVFPLLFLDTEVQTVKEDNSSQRPEVKHMHPDDLKTLFHAEDIARELFPKQRLFNFYLGYRLYDENIPLIFCERGGAFISMLGTNNQTSSVQTQHSHLHRTKSTQSGELTQQEERLTADNNNIINQPRPLLKDSNSAKQVAMVTFYYCYPIPTGFLYYLDIYSRPNLKNNLYADHLRSHLKQNLEMLVHHFPSQDGILTVAFDVHTSKADVEACLAEVNIVKRLEGQESGQILYERIRMD